MNLTYYNIYNKWMTEFLDRWDYTILIVFIVLLASIGVGVLCYLYDYWLFKEIWDD